MVAGNPLHIRVILGKGRDGGVAVRGALLARTRRWPRCAAHTGFGCGDRTLALTGRRLRARGYRPGGIGINLGCTTDLATRLEQRLEEHADRTGGRVVVLGQSRGRQARPSRGGAQTRPRARTRALASPVHNPLGSPGSVMRAVRLLTRLSALGLRGLLNDNCLTGDCYRTNTTAIAAPLPRRGTSSGRLLPTRRHRALGTLPRPLCRVRRDIQQPHRNGAPTRLLPR